MPIPKGEDRAASCRPPSVLTPGTALGSCRHGALSSAQAGVPRRAAEPLGKRTCWDLCHPQFVALLTVASESGEGTVAFRRRRNRRPSDVENKKHRWESPLNS